MTSTQANKATYLRLLAASNSGDLTAFAKCIDEIVDPAVLLHVPAQVGSTGAEAVKEITAMFHRAFPDIHTTAEDVIAGDDKVVSRQTISGTHKGEYMGIAATGRSVRYDEIFVYRFANGRIVEVWGVVDVLSLMKQLGVIAA